MSRFDDPAYTRLLQRIASPDCCGISYIERVWVALVDAKEPRVWRTSSPLALAIFCVLLVAFLLLLFAAAFGNGPRGIFPLLPLAGLILWAPTAALAGRIRKHFALRCRAQIDTAAFVAASGASGQDGPEVADAVRLALGRIYGVPPTSIRPGDTGRSLGALVGGLVPYAFEVVLGTRLIMGDQFCTDDPGVDDVLQRVHDEANTVADIVRIMNGAYGRKVSGKGEAPGTPEGGNAQW